MKLDKLDDFKLPAWRRVRPQTHRYYSRFALQLPLTVQDTSWAGDRLGRL